MNAGNKVQRPTNNPTPIELRGFSLKQIAVFAFIIGVLLHACVAFAVMGGGGGGSDNGGDDNTPPVSVEPAPTATPSGPVDRTNCEEIAGTSYRSDTEREWYLANCRGAQAAPSRVTPTADVRAQPPG